jgi:hypothetical protein
MNVWMKRALQTGLFTGGLLALGSGIASADDTAVDVTVPVTVTDNAVAVLGTTGDLPAEIQLPELAGTIDADLGAIALTVPITVGGNAADAAGIDVAQPAAQSADQPAPGGSDGSDGSAVDADVPVTVTGNAVGVLGDATAGGSAPASTAKGDSASVADVELPVLVCGNGIAALGDASGDCTAPASSTPGTGGEPTVGADVPVTACGNGIAAFGDASGDCTSPGSPGGPSTPPVAAQPGAFPRVVAPASSGLPIPADGSTTTSTRTESELAYTGSPVGSLLLAGLLALTLGLGLTALSRRRVGALG